MTKTIYHYDPATGDFNGAGEADKDPLDQGNWLIPANATDIAPPSPVSGKRRVFDGSSWSLIDIPVPPIADIRAAVWNSIKYERDRRTKTGGYKVGTKWFHSDEFSRSQQLGLIALGANISPNLQWKTMDGSFVPMTQTLAQQILVAGAASDQAIFTAAETHKAAMEASADPSAYDFSTGWPKVFGE